MEEEKDLMVCTNIKNWKKKKKNTSVIFIQNQPKKIWD